ncbi:MAG: hypothetical protein MUQ30_03075 [Anaerolineae bacterium]|nr:hypothetical protein [Anaerolineae bacterium]
MTAFSLNTVISVAAGLLQARLVLFYLSPADYRQLNVYPSFLAADAVFLGRGLGRVFTSEVARARGTGEYGLARSLTTLYSLPAFASGILLLLVFVGIGIWRDDIVMWAILGAHLLFSARSNITPVLLHSTTHYRRVAAQSIARNLSGLGLPATMPWWWRGDPIAGVALTYPLMELAGVVASLGLSWSTWQRL